jgi:hypothetical protein
MFLLCSDATLIDGLSVHNDWYIIRQIAYYSLNIFVEKMCQNHVSEYVLMWEHKAQRSYILTRCQYLHYTAMNDKMNDESEMRWIETVVP